jgi:hypothetical protein
MKNIKYIIALLLFGCFLTGCDNKLDVTNPNTATTSEFWQTEDHIAEGVIAIYNRLLTDGGFGRMMPSLTDVRGDDARSESPWTIYPLSGDFTVLSDYDVLEWMWREFYIMIDRANLVLNYADGIEYSSEDYKQRLVGQAYFLRAFSYYYLIELYEKVPLILTVPDDNNDYYPETTERSVIIKQIISDLKIAQEYLPKSYDDVSGDDAGQSGRATWGAATGYLTRTYLINANWEEAKTELKKIIDSKCYKLMDNYGDNFTYENENNKESLFEVQFGDYGSDENWLGYSTTDWKQGSCVGFNYGLTQFGAWGDIKPTEWLYNEFKKEATADGGVDPRLYWTLVTYEDEYNTATDGRTNKIFETYPYENGTLTKGSIYIAKWTYARLDGHTAESDGVRMSSVINQRLLRYADVLLLYAETLNETGSTTDAYKYVNMVRNRAYLSNLPDGMSQSEMRDEIIHQRVLELSLEGIRTLDIKRWGWYYDQNKLNELTTHDDEFGTWKEGHEYFPIPSGEMDTNPNLSPNSAN